MDDNTICTGDLVMVVKKWVCPGCGGVINQLGKIYTVVGLYTGECWCNERIVHKLNTTVALFDKNCGYDTSILIKIKPLNEETETDTELELTR